MLFDQGVDLTSLLRRGEGRQPHGVASMDIR